MSGNDPYLTLLALCESREGHILPDAMRHRLAEMWKRSIEKAILVGWHKSEEALVPEVGTPAILRAAERAVHDTL